MRHIRIYAFIFCLFLSGCATTEQVLLATDDQIGIDYPDIFLKFHYAYAIDNEAIICVDVLRQQKRVYGAYYLEEFRYEFTLPIPKLEQYKKSESRLYYVRDRYNIDREHIAECKAEGTYPPRNAFEIVTIEYDNFVRIKPDGGKQFDYEKVALSVTPGNFLYMTERNLVYVTQDHNLVKIKTKPPITKGNKAAYLLVPFAAIYDVVVFPFRMLGSLALLNHGS